MIRQDCDELKFYSSLPFADYGCKLFCLYYFDEQINNTYYDAEKIVNTTEQLINKQWIKNQLSVYEAGYDGINYSKLILNWLGVPAVDVVYKPANYQCKNNEHEILKLEKPHYSHFVAGNQRSDYSYDSLGIRPQQKEYKLKSKRIIIL